MKEVNWKISEYELKSLDILLEYFDDVLFHEDRRLDIYDKFASINIDRFRKEVQEMLKGLDNENS